MEGGGGGMKWDSSTGKWKRTLMPAVETALAPAAKAHVEFFIHKTICHLALSVFISSCDFFAGVQSISET